MKLLHFTTLLLGLFSVVTADFWQLPGDADEYQDLLMSDFYNQNETTCPNALDILPCECETYDGTIHTMDLDCSDVMSEEQLKQIFESDFPVETFRKFSIGYNDHLKVLESYVFNGVSFETIHIYGSALEVVENSALESSYETAYKLLFEGNYITSFPFDKLSQFTQLTTLSFEVGLGSMVPAGAFDGLTTLENLYIHNNYPYIVGPFENLPKLRNIILYGNGYTNIPTKFINTGSSNLEEIGLFNNKIVTVEPGAFDIVDGLKYYMSTNYLSTLDEATWRPILEGGGVLQADDNPLSCGCDISWLYNNTDHLLDQVSSDTTCSDGQNIHDLDPSIFDDC